MTTRRNLLKSIPACGLAAIVPAAAVAATEPVKTPHKQAVWHMRELEKMFKASGAKAVTVLIVGHDYGDGSGLGNCKSMQIQAASGNIIDDDDIFASKGGAS